MTDVLSRAQDNLYAPSDDDWDTVCRFSEGGLPGEIVEFSGRVSDLRRVRNVLGVREDEKLIEETRKSGAQCGPL
jgi:hypothetical protein